MFDALGATGVAALPGAREPGAMEQFHQYNDFYYLTGVELPDAALLLDGAKREALLFLPPRDPAKEAWTGAKLGPGWEAANRTGMDVLSRRDFLATAAARVPDGTVLWLPRGTEEQYTRISDVGGDFDRARRQDPLDGRENDYRTFADALARRFPDRKIEDLTGVVRRLRLRKSDHELALIRRASRISAQVLRRTIAAGGVGLYEYQLAAMLVGGYLFEGARGYAYYPIVGAGPNSTTLHYVENTRRISDGDLVLVDAACWYQYYTSDVTRTWPANGRFTPRQAEIYDVVLAAQQAALKECKPGSSLMNVHRAAQAVINAAGYGRYFTHGTSHFVGMAVHDPGGYAQRLEPGMVFTVEPGIYLKENALGVRLEDTVVITADGYENLTAECPKDRAALEALIAGDRR